MIEPGDLVVVVRGCCDWSKSNGVGWVFTVSRIVAEPGAECWHCGAPCELRAIAERPFEWRSCAPVPWLKKIPPLTEEESIEGVESVHAQG